MKEENYIKFRNYVLEFIEYLNSNKLKVIIIHDDNNSKYPEISFKIKGINWIFGIWAVGNWSDFYRCNEDDKISFFGIHNWRLDKFRPSYSDFEYVFHIKNNHYKYFWEKCKDDLTDIFIFLLLHTRDNDATWFEKLFASAKRRKNVDMKKIDIVMQR